MELFGFGKKKESCASCVCGTGTEIGSVKVLGGGCRSCESLLENTRAAAQRVGYVGEVEYITDMEKIMAYGVMQIPLLVVDEKVVSCGKVLSARQVEELFRKI